ncbi:ACP S-malonyltransferase [Paenibacillus sp. MMS18-CY102]|uniref:ACP S-malonyltransferase n=1 Tax=Paenibacillus sp. MMS18-CY102 TaxID=2682849 RepID=UPI0013663885|nr:ACP S-malonyltransferase [Paenibacillus sp. MMS18-CY102]MWC28305.1 ACP S-malonyltransferase [Paenibacillus sp. MMS18-CY102]
MRSKIVFMFAGQGSQYYGMGRSLFDNETVYREIMLSLDKIVQSNCNFSVIDVLGNKGPSKPASFGRTLHTHPAIFMTEYALAQTLIRRGIQPDYVLGTSLGEFAAAAIAGIMEPEMALEAVIRQAQAFETHCEAGGMAAVLDNPAFYAELPLLNQNSEMVAVNNDAHFVIAGTDADLGKIRDGLNSKGIISLQLPVSHGFHSRLIDRAREPFMAYLNRLAIRKPSIGFISGLSGEQVTQLQPSYFWDIAREQMHFSKSIATLRHKYGDSLIFADMSPGGTLGNFTKRLIDDSLHRNIVAFLSPFADQKGYFEQSVNKMTDMMGLNGSERPQFKSKGDRVMLAYMFPGQGSQVKGMGGQWFDQFPEITKIADRVLGYSIKDLCLNDPERKLGQTAFTQPALYTVNALAYMSKFQETGQQPDYLIGHSLGEYNALLAGGAFDFETGLRLVQKRGELMGMARGGGMAAVIGLDEDRIQQIIEESGAALSIANHNSPSQIVISGKADDIGRVEKRFADAGAVYVPLNVSGAFHSTFMNEAYEQFKRFVQSFKFGKLAIPVISNVYARPYRSAVMDDTLSKQMVSAVKWTESIRYVMGKGEVDFVEIGPGDVLKKLVTKIKLQAEPLIVEDEELEDETEAEVRVEVEALQQQAEVQANERLDGNTDVPASVKSEQVTVEHAQIIESYHAAVGAQTEAAAAHAVTGHAAISPATLGNEAFRKEYRLKYAYLVGPMHRGISSSEMVVKAAKAGMLGFLGADGLETNAVERELAAIKNALTLEQPYGANIVYNPHLPEAEEKFIQMYLKHGVSVLMASEYLSITPALVMFRANGIRRQADGSVASNGRIIGKVSRPEVAEAFLKPAPARIVEKLLITNVISAEQAELLKELPMADELCVEGDSGGYTEGASLTSLLPTIIRLRNEMLGSKGGHIRIGAAGGIGTPESAAAAFLMGADFIVTGSINQCTVEARTSDSAKDLLQQMNIQDTEYVPSSAMFEMGAKVQVLKRGVFFPARANKLYDFYRVFQSLDEIGEKNSVLIQEKYFKRSFTRILEDIRLNGSADEIAKASGNGKQQMALVFKWYLEQALSFAVRGEKEHQIDYQIFCGPALGAFNQWVKGTELEHWRNRNVDVIGLKLLEETAALLLERLQSLCEPALAVRA